MYNLSYVNFEDKDEYDIREKIFNKANCPPPNFKKMEATVAGSKFQFVPKLIEMRTFKKTASGRDIPYKEQKTATLYHSDMGYGYATVQYAYPQYNQETGTYENTMSLYTFDAKDNLEKFYNSLVEQEFDWKMNERSNPSRGYRNYDKVVKFNRELSPTELKYVTMHLNNNSPGWTGIVCKPRQDNVIAFNTTYDSGD